MSREWKGGRGPRILEGVVPKILPAFCGTLISTCERYTIGVLDFFDSIPLCLT